MKSHRFNIVRLLLLLLLLPLVWGNAQVRRPDPWDVENNKDAEEKNRIKGFVPPTKSPPQFKPWVLAASMCNDEIIFHVAGWPVYLNRSVENDTIWGQLSRTPDERTTVDTLMDTTEMFVTLEPSIYAVLPGPVDTAHLQLIISDSGVLTTQPVHTAWFLNFIEARPLPEKIEGWVVFGADERDDARRYIGSKKRDRPGMPQVLVTPGWYSLVSRSGECSVTYLDKVSVGRHLLSNQDIQGRYMIFLTTVASSETSPLLSTRSEEGHRLVLK